MAITYTVTDSKGATYTRKSARHLTQEYFFAVCHIPGKPGKANINYCSTKALALRQRDQIVKWGYPDAEIREVSAI